MCNIVYIELVTNVLSHYFIMLNIATHEKNSQNKTLVCNGCKIRSLRKFLMVLYCVSTSASLFGIKYQSQVRKRSIRVQGFNAIHLKNILSGAKSADVCFLGS